MEEMKESGHGHNQMLLPMIPVLPLLQHRQIHKCLNKQFPGVSHVSYQAESTHLITLHVLHTKASPQKTCLHEGMASLCESRKVAGVCLSWEGLVLEYSSERPQWVWFSGRVLTQHA